MKKKLFSCLAAILLLFTIFSLPAGAATYTIDFELNCSSVELVNLDTNTIVYSKNADEKRYPASLTKIMVYIIVIENVSDPDGTTTTVSKEAIEELQGTGGSSSGLKAGDKLTITQLLNCLMVPSGNDAAIVLSDFLCDGSTSAFVEKMNQKAQELGCKNTHFTNVHGLHDENHYTTAHDMAVITEYAMNTPNFMEISDQTRYTYSPLDGPEKGTERMVTTSNRLIDPNLDPQYYYSYARGIKTGFTDEAGYCIVSNAVNPNTGYSYLCVAMGAPSVDKNGNKVEKHGECIDSKNLYEWAFDSLRIQKIAAKEDAVTEIPLKYAWNKDKLLLTPEDDCSTILPEDISASSVLATPNIPESVEAPVKKGQVIGTVTFSYAGQDLLTTNLVAAESVERSELLKSAATIKDVVTSGWFLAIAAVVIVLVAAYLILALIYNRKKKKLRTVKKYKDL